MIGIATDRQGDCTHALSICRAKSRSSVAVDMLRLCALAIGRMMGIEWPTILTNFRAVASYFDDLFLAVVTRLAQALQFAGDEFRPIASVFFDVIDDRSGHHVTATGADRAQRMLAKLKRAKPLPARRIVPAVPRIIAVIGARHGV